MSISDAQTDRYPSWITAQPWFRPAMRLRRVIAVAVAVLVLDALLYTAWVQPMVTGIDAQETASQEVRDRLQQLFLLERAKHDLDQIATALPLRKDRATTSSEVSSLARRKGVAIRQINFSQVETPSKQWSKVTLQFSAGGEYAKIRRFLAAIEAAEEPFAVESLSLQRASKSGDVTAKFVVGIYAKEK